jgi:CRP/FNR family transcriptional regulator, cyclic AMP receptor protein
LVHSCVTIGKIWIALGEGDLHGNVTSADAPYAVTLDLAQRAIASSLLSELPEPLRARVLADALPVELPAGGTIYREEGDPRCVLITAGLVRIVVSAPDGRSLTIRYAGAGELLGVPTLIGGPVPVSGELVTDTHLLVLNARVLRHLGQTEPALGWLLAREVTQRLYDTIDAVADRAFGSLRQRVAHHLLDLACGQQDGRLVAPITQQQLADAVGSARPAVAKVVAELRALGLVTTASPGIAILDAEGLHAQTWLRQVSPE